MTKFKYVDGGGRHDAERCVKARSHETTTWDAESMKKKSPTRAVTTLALRWRGQIAVMRRWWYVPDDVDGALCDWMDAEDPGNLASCIGQGIAWQWQWYVPDDVDGDWMDAEVPGNLAPCIGQDIAW